MFAIASRYATRSRFAPEQRFTRPLQNEQRSNNSSEPQTTPQPRVFTVEELATMRNPEPLSEEQLTTIRNRFATLTNQPAPNDGSARGSISDGNPRSDSASSQVHIGITRDPVTTTPIVADHLTPTSRGRGIRRTLPWFVTNPQTQSRFQNPRIDSDDVPSVLPAPRITRPILRDEVGGGLPSDENETDTESLRERQAESESPTDDPIVAEPDYEPVITASDYGSHTPPATPRRRRGPEPFPRIPPRPRSRDAWERPPPPRSPRDAAYRDYLQSLEDGTLDEPTAEPSYASASTFRRRDNSVDATTRIHTEYPYAIWIKKDITHYPTPYERNDLFAFTNLTDVLWTGRTIDTDGHYQAYSWLCRSPTRFMERVEPQHHVILHSRSEYRFVNRNSLHAYPYLLQVPWEENYIFAFSQRLDLRTWLDTGRRPLQYIRVDPREQTATMVRHDNPFDRSIVTSSRIIGHMDGEWWIHSAIGDMHTYRFIREGTISTFGFMDDHSRAAFAHETNQQKPTSYISIYNDNKTVDYIQWDNRLQNYVIKQLQRPEDTGEALLTTYRNVQPDDAEQGIWEIEDTDIPIRVARYCSAKYVVKPAFVATEVPCVYTEDLVTAQRMLTRIGQGLILLEYFADPPFMFEDDTWEIREQRQRQWSAEDTNVLHIYRPTTDDGNSDVPTMTPSPDREDVHDTYEGSASHGNPLSVPAQVGHDTAHAASESSQPTNIHNEPEPLPAAIPNTTQSTQPPNNEEEWRAAAIANTTTVTTQLDQVAQVPPRRIFMQDTNHATPPSSSSSNAENQPTDWQ